MATLDSTHLVLWIVAGTSIAHLLLLIAGAVWAHRQFARFSREMSRLEATHWQGLMARTDAMLADLHTIAGRADRVGREVERVAVTVQDMLSTVSWEVDRATRGARVAMDLVEGVYRQASSFGAGLRAGIQELLARRQDPHGS